MIKKWINFMEDFLIESMVKESYIYFSPRLKDVLHRIGSNDISQSLLDVEGKNIEPDMTFLDISDVSGNLTFVTMKNAKGRLSSQTDKDDWETHPMNIDQSYYDVLVNKTDIFSKKSRNEVSLGRLINKFFPKKFTDKEKEEFVNIFKSKVNEEPLLIEVSGDEISYWYDSSNYKELKGSLGNSCMKDKKPKIFDIYCKNPEVCKMLILVEDDKLLGRALVWKVKKCLDSKGSKIDVEWFMDRQYTINDYDVIKFKEYAQKEGWAFRTHNNHTDYSDITYNGKSYSGVEMWVSVKGCPDYFPYMDTFKQFDPSEEILRNTDEREYGMYILNNTDGTASIPEDDERVWSEYYDEYIDEDEAVWSNFLNDWIRSDDSCEVTRGSGRYIGYYPSDYGDIVSTIDDDYLHIDDALYSDYYDTYILYDNGVRYIKLLEDDGTIDGDIDDYVDESDRDFLRIDQDKNWFKFIKKVNDYDDGDLVIHSRIMIKDSLTNEYFPKILAVKVFKTIDSEIPYLMKVDSIILDIKIDESEEYIVDGCEYTKSIPYEKIKRYLKRYNLEDQLELPGMNANGYLIKLFKERKNQIDNDFFIVD